MFALLVALLRVLAAVSPVRPAGEHASWHVAPAVPVSQELHAERAAPATAMPRAERTSEHLRADACDVSRHPRDAAVTTCAAHARTLTAPHAVVTQRAVDPYLPNPPPRAR